MSFLVVALAALVVAALTLFSGFGLGTLLMPVFALFFPVEVAVGATAVVHFANNCFKLALVGKWADQGVVLRFGLPAILAAIVGAWLLRLLAGVEPLATWQLGARACEVTPVKLVIAALIAVFAVVAILTGVVHAALHAVPSDDPHFSHAEEWLCQLAGLHAAPAIEPASRICDQR